MWMFACLFSLVCLHLVATYCEFQMSTFRCFTVLFCIVIAVCTSRKIVYFVCLRYFDDRQALPRGAGESLGMRLLYFAHVHVRKKASLSASPLVCAALLAHIHGSNQYIHSSGQYS